MAIVNPTRADGAGWSTRSWTISTSGDTIDARGIDHISAVITVDTGNSDTVHVLGSNDNVKFVELGSYTADAAVELSRFAYYQVTFGGASKVNFYGDM